MINHHKKPHNAGNSRTIGEQEQSKKGTISSLAKRTIVGTRRSHFYFAGYVSSDPDESDVNNHPGSEVVYLQEVLWILGVINTALHWNIDIHCSAIIKIFTLTLTEA